MNITLAKYCFYLFLFTVLTITAFVTKDAISNAIFSSLAILLGLFVTKKLSTQIQEKDGSK